MPGTPRGRGVRRRRERGQRWWKVGWVRLELPSAPLHGDCGFRVLPCAESGCVRQDLAGRQKARLRVEQGEVIRKNQARAGSPPRECEWDPAEEAAEGAKAET